MWSRSGRFLVVGVLAGLAMSAREASAQGIMIDVRRPVPVARSFEIREVRIDARVRDQVAEVQVSQTFHNPGSFQVESEYLFPLPEEGAIQNFVLLVDGQEMPGKLMARDEARRIYEEIVRTKRDPALLEYMGRGLFKTSVFPIPPHADRKVTMRYTQLCKRDRDVVEFAYPLGTQKFTSKPIQRLELDLRIESRDPIKSVYCPTYDARVERRDDHEARARVERYDVIPTADFRLVYTLASGSLGANVLSHRPTESEDGYFLLLASPEVKPADTRPRPKTVIFVLDRSGSMSGKKIDQARKALQFVLNNLRDDDLFNIVAYDDRVESFRPELQRYSSDSRREAERFVDNIREGGSTNIDAALKTALGMIRDDSRPSYVLFLTDGLPTAGETGELAISDHCRRENQHHARLFAFGVGFDVNARLLDRLSGGNSGTSEYVKPDEDIESHVSRFYAKLTSPVLTDIRIELSGTDVNRTYPRDIPDLFEGGQLVWVGRYRQAGRSTVRLSGKVGDERRSFEFPVELASTDRGSSHDYVERIWAVRRVGDIIDQIDLHGRNKELIDELVSLSTRYGILTPYTSFLADDRVSLHAWAENATRAGRSLQELEQVTGMPGVNQRLAKQNYQAADKLSESLAYSYQPGANQPSAGAQQGQPGQSAPNQAQANRPGRSLGGLAGGMGGSGLPGNPAGNSLYRVEPFREGSKDSSTPLTAGTNGPGAANFNSEAAASPPALLGQAQGPASAEAKRAAEMRGVERKRREREQERTLSFGVGVGVTARDTRGNETIATTVRQVGSKTFYFKNNRWVDSTVKPEDEPKAIVIEQLSDRFFELARSQKAEMNQYLTFNEPVTVELGGQVYRFDPPAP
jgi:Ca-activated chloride channel family protein